jgi:hypothetical protein
MNSLERAIFDDVEAPHAVKLAALQLSDLADRYDNYTVGYPISAGLIIGAVVTALSLISLALFGALPHITPAGVTIAAFVLISVTSCVAGCAVYAACERQRSATRQDLRSAMTDPSFPEAAKLLLRHGKEIEPYRWYI